jgi:hypothetical protein
VKVSLICSEKKRIFADHGKQVMHACVGPQTSRNSMNVLYYALLLEKLPKHHWDSLVWPMQCAEMCFEMIADHQVISHLHHAKKVVPFKTMSDTSNSFYSFSKYYGSIAIGTNVFLHCHTNADFTMIVCQVFLKWKSEYHLNDNVVIYFCFPTLGVAVPLCPGNYLMFNALIPHIKILLDASLTVRSCVCLCI